MTKNPDGDDCMADLNLVASNRPDIMGILNVTPDSFSDGGDFYTTEVAIDHGLRMVAEGADIIDVGGESTRPGADRIPAEEQVRRVVPVISGLRKQLPDRITISVDTTLTAVARAACAAGAGMINDIAAGEDDAGILQLAAANNIPIILMHKQGTPASMQHNPAYDDVIEDIRAYLLSRVETAMQAGVNKQNLILDPGFGFGKTMEHNLLLLASLGRFADTGFPILIGASRKAFLSSVCQVEDRKELVGASSATTVIGVMAGVRLFRVHDVKEHRQAADVAYVVKSEKLKVKS
ncbi:MAG: folP [Gammaproteobacteria bacterium]|nr:folP [Gammaproteobacteria bacterium]